MREHIDFIIQFLKEQENIRGCITGSSLLGEYWDGMDVDLFVYDEKSLNRILTILEFDNRFQILDPREQWKFDQQIIESKPSSDKNFIQTIKFIYNTYIPVNIIYKKSCFNIFSVLATFDMDIVSLGYDLETKQFLDLGNKESRDYKIASWNTWNKAFYTTNLWETSRILRQLERCFKYHKRGYNTDLVVEKYIELINDLQALQNIFKDSDTYTGKLSVVQSNTKIIKQICEVWLETHEISDETLEKVKTKVREI